MRRLFDDPQTPVELREDLRRTREAGADYDVAAGLSQLRAALAAPPPAAPGVGGAKSGFGWFTIPTSWKLLALAAVGGSAALLVLPAQRQVAGVSARLPEQAGRPASVRVAASVPPTAASPQPSLDVQTSDAAPVPGPKRESANPPASSSRREIAQLVRIRSLLEQNPAAAYQLALRSEREFPQGNLREERQALLVQALAKSGATDEAARKAREFFARYPQSPLRDRVDAALPH